MNSEQCRRRRQSSLALSSENGWHTEWNGFTVINRSCPSLSLSLFHTHNQPNARRQTERVREREESGGKCMIRTKHQQPILIGHFGNFFWTLFGIFFVIFCAPRFKFATCSQQLDPKKNPTASKFSLCLFCSKHLYVLCISVQILQGPTSWLCLQSMS